jgi:hypothetical protein
MKITASQQKTLDYIEANGPIPTNIIGQGYSWKSAEALERKGVLVLILGETYTLHCRDGHTEEITPRYLGLPGQAAPQR